MNGAIAIVVYRDLDLYFNVTKFQKIQYLENGERKRKCSGTTVLESDNSHRIAPLRMLYIVIFSCIFKITQFLEIYKYAIAGKRWELAKHAQ